MANTSYPAEKSRHNPSDRNHLSSGGTALTQSIEGTRPSIGSESAIGGSALMATRIPYKKPANINHNQIIT